jgi:hypothetical protein
VNAELKDFSTGFKSGRAEWRMQFRVGGSHGNRWLAGQTLMPTPVRRPCPAPFDGSHAKSPTPGFRSTAFR